METSQRQSRGMPSDPICHQEDNGDSREKEEQSSGSVMSKLLRKLQSATKNYWLCERILYFTEDMETINVF